MPAPLPQNSVSASVPKHIKGLALLFPMAWCEIMHAIDSKLDTILTSTPAFERPTAVERMINALDTDLPVQSCVSQLIVPFYAIRKQSGPCPVVTNFTQSKWELIWNDLIGTANTLDTFMRRFRKKTEFDEITGLQDSFQKICSFVGDEQNSVYTILNRELGARPAFQSVWNRLVAGP